MSTAPTDTELALLAEICADPADATPRLVLVDWLLENAGPVPCPQCEHVEASGYAQKDFPSHASGKCRDCGSPIGIIGTVPDGREERAEFIRAQCELARRWPENGGLIAELKELASNERNALRRRERELWGNNTKLWFPTSGNVRWYLQLNSDEFDASTSGSIVGLVSRGFVSTITCSWTAWHGGACERCGGRTQISASAARSHEVQQYDEWRPMIPCPNCSGSGRLPGIARHLHWHPGATDDGPLSEEERQKYDCGVCGNWPDEDGTLQHGKGCYKQNDDGGGTEHIDLPVSRVPRPIPATAQPVTRVKSTTIPDMVGELDKWSMTRDKDRAQEFFHKDYPGIIFELPTARPAATR